MCLFGVSQDRHVGVFLSLTSITRRCPCPQRHHFGVSLTPGASPGGVAMSSGSVILGCPHPQGHRLGVSLSHEHHLGVSLYPGGTSGGVHLPIWGVPIPRSVILGCPYTLLGVSLSPGASFEGVPVPRRDMWRCPRSHLGVSPSPGGPPVAVLSPSRGCPGVG